MKGDSAKCPGETVETLYDRPLIPPRKCHDCGRKTRNYRCGHCRRLWRLRHGVLLEEHGEDD